MAKYIAVGTLAAWNALSPAEQAFYDGGHALTYGAANSLLPATPTDDWEIRAISDVDNTSRVTWKADFNGYSLTINGMGYLMDTTYVADDFVWTSATNFSQLSIINFRVFFNVVKLSAKAVCRFDACAIPIYTDELGVDGNGSKIGYLLYILNSSGTLSLIRSESIDIDAHIRIFSGTTVVDIENCRATNVNRGILTTGGGAVNIKNNYFDGSTQGINGTVVDQGGNTTSDATAPEVARQNRSVVDSFEDQISWIPKDVVWMVGVIPSFSTYSNGVTTVDNYWTGPNGRSVGGDGDTNITVTVDGQEVNLLQNTFNGNMSYMVFVNSSNELVVYKKMWKISDYDLELGTSATINS